MKFKISFCKRPPKEFFIFQNEEIVLKLKHKMRVFRQLKFQFLLFEKLFIKTNFINYLAVFRKTMFFFARALNQKKPDLETTFFGKTFELPANWCVWCATFHDTGMSRSERLPDSPYEDQTVKNPLQRFPILTKCSTPPSTYLKNVSSKYFWDTFQTRMPNFWNCEC